MAQVIVRNLEETVKQGLKYRASRHGRSMDEEVREILRNAVRESAQPPVRLGSRIASRFADVGLGDEFPEFHGTSAHPADFGE
jgi:plasmid stability protein